MVKNKKTALILGAGPSGLACAYEILTLNCGIKPILIEKSDCVGGISRTVYFDNLGVDIGGHRLYSDDEYIKSIWNKFLPLQNSPSIDDIYANREVSYPSEGLNPQTSDNVMLIRRRFSDIIYNSKMFPYPIKFDFDIIKKLGLFTSISACLSYIKSTLFKRKVKNLEDFMVNRFGRVLYEIFFKDYTKKVWGVDSSEISEEWGKERIRKLSLFKAVVNAILSKFSFLKFKKEASLIDEFFYPKYGCSELWNLMADYIVKNGGEIIFNAEFSAFNIEDKKIKSVEYISNNKTKTINADYFISSIAISDLIEGFDAPCEIKKTAKELPYRDYILVSFYTDKLNLKNNTDFKTPNNITPDCWLYLQEKDTLASRIQIMNNWSPYLVQNFCEKYLISLEYYCNKGDDIDSLSDDEIIKLAVSECEKYNFFNSENILKSKVIRQEKAYPSYFGGYKYINEIKNFLKSYENLYLIGRNGQHKYYNMDTAMVCGINIAREICK